ncbi:hypothetical protein ACOBQX_07725 [Actinokineospora sp. G85]|uniref:CRISPR-associated endonuclease Cas2 n=1 Tax=Actinokineospora sp. G85 TaxID=3406626 RepID=UPI003C77D6A1
MAVTMAGDWLVTFDVPGDAARRAVTRALEPHGFRVAHSVFRLRASTAAVDRIVDLARPALAGGHLAAVPSCTRCWSNTLGQDYEPEPDNGWVTW